MTKLGGVEWNAQNNGGQTPLHMAVEYGYICESPTEKGTKLRLLDYVR